MVQSNTVEIWYANAATFGSPQLRKPEHFKVPILPQRWYDELLRVFSCPVLLERVPVETLGIAQIR